MSFRNHSVPLYYQLENILREKIRSGEYRPGDPFPTEEQLIKEYKVSRITVRQALSALEKDSLITRHRGKGTFVSQVKGHLEPMKLTGWMEDIIDMGIKTKTKIINFGFVYPPKNVEEKLKLGEQDKVLRIERVRLIQDAPISYTLSYIPPDLGKKINIKDLTIYPILNILERKCKLKIMRGTQIIEATVADSRIASLLDVMTGSPLLKIERVVFDSFARPVEYISILYRSDRYHYSVDLVRRRSETNGRWDYMKIK